MLNLQNNILQVRLVRMQTWRVEILSMYLVLLYLLSLLNGEFFLLVS